MENELFKAAGHLIYEWNQLDYCAGRLPQLDPRSREHAALLTAFALHTRNLIGFFYPELSQGRDTDMQARDSYHRPDDWENIHRPAIDFVAHKKRADKLAAHLTYTRSEIPLQDAQWPVQDIRHDLQKVWDAFMSTAERNRGT